MKDIKARILSNERVAFGYFKMRVYAPFIAHSAQPGQFVQVRFANTLDPLLRRPFSIHRIVRSSTIEILYEVVGKGTEILARKKKGDFLDVLGPLGNGFTLPRTTDNGQRTTILVAGGIGVAPLIFLAEKLMEIKNKKLKIKNIVLIGGNTGKLILCEKDFKRLGAEVHIATDDGSYGYKGLVTELLRKVLLSTVNCPRHKDQRVRLRRKLLTIYACGPAPMLQRIAGICKRQGIECQVSLEERMACGIGACLGCAVKVRKPRSNKGFVYKLACKDGPVFDARQVVW